MTEAPMRNIALRPSNRDARCVTEHQASHGHLLTGKSRTQAKGLKDKGQPPPHG